MPWATSEPLARRCTNVPPPAACSSPGLAWPDPVRVPTSPVLASRATSAAPGMTTPLLTSTRSQRSSPGSLLLPFASAAPGANRTPRVPATPAPTNRRRLMCGLPMLVASFPASAGGQAAGGAARPALKQNRKRLVASLQDGAYHDLTQLCGVSEVKQGCPGGFVTLITTACPREGRNC